MEEMGNISARLDSVLEVLEMFDKQPDLPLPAKDRILNFHLDLRFLKLFSMLIMKCGAGAAGQEAKLDSIRINIEALLEEDERTEQEWENLASEVLQTLKNLKINIEEICDDLWDSSLDAISGTSTEEITEFLDLVLWNLRDFVNLKEDDLSSPMKKQIKVLHEKLCFVGNLFDFTSKGCSDQQKLEEFWSFMQGVMNYSACLSVLYWTNTAKDENLSTNRLDSMPSDLLGKIKPQNPMAIEIYFGVLLPSKSSQYAKFLISEIVVSLCDLLLEDLVAPLIKDRFEVFREWLIFSTTFLMNPPEKPEREAGDVLLTRIDDIIRDVVSCICAFYRDDNIEMYIPPKVEEILSGVREEIDKVMAEIRAIFVPIPDFSCSNFPVTNEIGFIDCLLENLKEIMKSQASKIAFATDKILSIQEDLLFIRAFLKDVMELKNEQQEVQDLWKRIINVAYHIEHVVNSCLIVDNPIWYDILSLSKVTEEMKFIKTEVKKVTDLEMNKARKPDNEYHSGPLLPRKANTSLMEEVFVGFKDEMQTIIDRLTRGTTQLDIVSIVGMPGQGKTTLAKKVYNDLSIKYHFHKYAWCYVSQVYQTKELLLDILTDVTGLDIRTSHPKACEDELAEWLWKSLKGRRFLIVMDDIWDIGAWDGIKRLLPDDENGSRIVFTSRVHHLVLQAKPNCNPHPIRLLNDEESWELLQDRVFYNDFCPEELSEVGKMIASECKGLPLAVVLVAGILARKDKNLDFWKEMIGTMASHIASKGCMDLVELSYKHLPDCLKPCFLYFGAFPEAKIIGVRKLMKLWAAEGFVPRDDVKRLDEMAGEYLMDLIDRSLVTIAARSSKGEVKDCRIHDLLHDFCLTKAREERFLHKLHGNNISDDSPKSTYEHYRLCIESTWGRFIDSRPAGSYVHSVVVSGTRVERGSSSRLASFFLGFKFLHVLDMEFNYTDDFFPEEITLMVHLRYLAIWCCTDYLPSSIANLWNLETLIVKSARLYTIPLPDSIWTMKTLRHIDIPTMTFKDYKSTDESCQLHNVVTFSTPTLTSGKETEELLRRLPQLRKLKCNFWEIYLDSDPDPIKFPSLTHLRQLESLAVYNGGDMVYGENYDQIPSFHFPNTLTKLSLENFYLTGAAISAIGKLPNLQVLKLRRLGFFDQRWDLEDGEFLNLKFLELSKVQIQQWNGCSEPFPCLERLVLKSCKSLEEIPPGFAEIPTLKRMDVYWCPKASSSVGRIVEEQVDLGNGELRVYIIDD